MIRKTAELSIRVISAFVLTMYFSLASHAAPPSPEVTVVNPKMKDLVAPEFYGRVEAVSSIEIRARVTGTLVKVLVTEGSDVKEGDLLFEIEPRRYKLAVDQAQAQLELCKAQYNLAKATYQRDKAAGFDAVSQLQLDQELSAVDEASERIKIAQAGLGSAKLDLEFCSVHSPITGQVGRFHVTPGNFCKCDETVLTNLVSQDVRVAFQIDGHTLTAMRQRTDAIPADIQFHLDGEPEFKRTGKIVFVDNRIDENSGKILVRSSIVKTKRDEMLQAFMPGMFVHIRLAKFQPSKEKILFVLPEVIESDPTPLREIDRPFEKQIREYVWIVDNRDVLRCARVITGPLQGGERVIYSGLSEKDRVVKDISLQRGLQEGMTVKAIQQPAQDHR